MTIDVVAACIRRRDRFLVCQRPVHKHHGGLWEFPGGKLQAHETLARAAVRELREELALYRPRCGPVLGSVTDPDAGVIVHFLEIDIDAQTPVPLEHDRIRWSTIAELRSADLPPADREFLMRFLAPATRP